MAKEVQLANWRIEDGKPQANLGFAMGLCQLVTRLRKKKEIKVEHVQPMFAPKHPYRGASGRFGIIHISQSIQCFGHNIILNSVPEDQCRNL